MHVDLNSCFAIIEQQANPLIRNKPVAVAAYDTPGGMIIASSYEAKALGIKLGINVREAKKIFRDVHILMPDPDKYFDVHRRFKAVLTNYSDKVWAKSVDEFLIDFSGSNFLRDGLSMEDIGLLIKKDVKDSLGEYVTINIGIGMNPFLAKLAAGLNKPDGMDRIDYLNILEVYSNLNLIDLPGINYRYEARLNLAGIYSPLDFFNAPLDKLKSEVFRSINGYYWYLRLRGYPIDTINFQRKSFGNQYALGNKTQDKNELFRLIMKLSEKTGRRLRKNNYYANQINLFLRFVDGNHFHKTIKTNPLYSTVDIYKAVRDILLKVKIESDVREIRLSVAHLISDNPEQLDLFSKPNMGSLSLAKFVDKVNDRYGEYVLVPALMANMEVTILKRVSFNQTEN